MHRMSRKHREVRELDSMVRCRDVAVITDGIGINVTVDPQDVLSPLAVLKS